MIVWDSITEKVQTALEEIPVVTLFGQPITNITPEMTAKVAVAAIREDVEAHIRTIPTVPTNKNDVIITLGGLALVGGVLAGFGYLMYKLDKSDSYGSSFPNPKPEKASQKPSDEKA